MKVFIIAASTLDGFIAQFPNQKSTKWTSQQDFQHFIKITQQAGVVILGRVTYDTIGKPLKNRLNIVLTSRPQPSKFSNLVYTHDSPQKILADLKKQGHQNIAICGGASIYSLFLDNNLIDEIYLTLEPIFFGQGISLFSKPCHQKLKLLDCQKANSQGTLFLHYQVLK